MGNTVAVQSVSKGMNTVMYHRAFGRHAEGALTAVRNKAVFLERMLSRYITKSEICRINISAGKECERLSDETFEVLSQAADFSNRCQGIFDITIGPLVTLWSGSKTLCNLPEDSKINHAVSLVNYNDLILDPYKRTAGLQRSGQSIDLGGIGKGFAGDEFLKVFREYGVSSAFTNIGGNVATLGTKPDGSPWRVGIQHPRQESSLIGFVSVADRAVVTSGDYQRFFIGSNGKRYHHILDPRTGYPAQSGLLSVTVVADSSMDADALSTILFVAGIERGLDIMRRFNGVEAVFIDKDLSVFVTTGLVKDFQASKGIKVNIINQVEGEYLYEKKGEV